MLFKKYKYNDVIATNKNLSEKMICIKILPIKRIIFNDDSNSQNNQLLKKNYILHYNIFFYTYYKKLPEHLYDIYLCMFKKLENSKDLFFFLYLENEFYLKKNEIKRFFFYNFYNFYGKLEFVLNDLNFYKYKIIIFKKKYIIYVNLINFIFKNKEKLFFFENFKLIKNYNYLEKNYFKLKITTCNKINEEFNF